MLRHAALLALFGTATFGRAAAAGSGQDFSQIERGRYLAAVGDCAACHTKPGGKPFAGGLPIETPFGKVVAPNITPDNETGIGLWSDEDFVRAVTQGIRRDGAHLFPAMPYTYYTRVSRDDVLAIRAYLETVPAVEQQRQRGSVAVSAERASGYGGVERALFQVGRIPSRIRTRARNGIAARIWPKG